MESAPISASLHINVCAAYALVLTAYLHFTWQSCWDRCRLPVDFTSTAFHRRYFTHVHLIDQYNLILA